MHVLILPSWYPHNKNDIRGSFFREQAIALSRNGLDVGVISPHLRSIKDVNKYLNERNKSDIEIDCEVRTIRNYGLVWMPGSYQLQRYLWIRLARKLFDKYIINFGLPDILHVHSMLFAGTLAREIKNKYKIPYIITEHSSRYMRNDIQRNDRRDINHIIKYSNGCYSVSSALSSLLEEQYISNNIKWNVIPNMLSKEFEIYKKNNKINNNFRYITVSTLANIKRVDNIIYAFNKLQKNVNNIELVIGGDGEEMKKLKKLTRELNINEKVMFLGLLSRDQVVSQIAKSNAYISASEHETFGVTIIEANALGLPVIATRCGGPEDLINENNGILVEKNNINELYDAMMYLRNNIDQYNSEQIRKECFDQYGEKAVVTKTIEIYKKVINSINKK